MSSTPNDSRLTIPGPADLPPRSAGGGVPANLALPNGLTLCLQSKTMIPAANYVVEEIFVEGQYTRKGFEIGESDTIVDVGANMGIFALWAAPQVPNGRIIAIEPIPDLAACLRASLGKNAIGNVSLVEKALGSPNSKIELSYYPGFNIISHRSDFRRPAYARAKMYLKNLSTWSTPKRLKVDCTSIGRLLDDHEVDRVDFLKIDCEGGEYDIVKNTGLRDWRRIDRLVIEFHEYHKSHSHLQLVQVLKNNGFEVDLDLHPINYRLMKFGTMWGKRLAR